MEDAMQYSLVLFATSLIPAAPGDAPADNKTAPPVTAVQSMMPVDVPPPRPTFGERLRNLFVPHRAARPDAPMLEPRDTGEFPPPPATSATSTPPAAKTNNSAPITKVTAMRPNFELADKDLKVVGHETDYSWITGKLMHAPGASDRWVLYYTAPYEQDRYGGLITLGSSPLLASYHEGDLICVHGKALAGRSGSASYEVHSVDLIDRAAR
jgi:hypothetical protein